MVGTRLREFVSLVNVSDRRSQGLGVGISVYTISTFNRTLRVNGEPLFTKCEFPQLVYLFKFKHYIVLRFFDSYKSENSFKYRWYSVAMNGAKIESYWDDKYSIVSNKALAMQIDMTSEV